MSAKTRWLGLAALAMAAAACTSVDPNATVLATCPSTLEFMSVSPFLEAGCGTLDCHGQTARPLRVFGKRGMRLDPADLPGGSDTTQAEMDENRRSFCSLEPEQMAAIIAGNAPIDDLLALQKARGETHHKGETIVSRGDDGDTCMTTWILGSVDAEACARAADLMLP